MQTRNYPFIRLDTRSLKRKKQQVVYGKLIKWLGYIEALIKMTYYYIWNAINFWHIPQRFRDLNWPSVIVSCYMQVRHTYFSCTLLKARGRCTWKNQITLYRTNRTDNNFRDYLLCHTERATYSRFFLNLLTVTSAAITNAAARFSTGQPSKSMSPHY